MDHAAEIAISRTSDKLTDTAVVTLPRRIKWKNVEKCPIRRGDPITIELGYDGRNHVAFVGYVSKVGAQTPLVIECDDPMMKTRVTTANKLSYVSTDIRTLLKDQGLDPIVKGKQNIGAYRVCCNTVAELLDSLKKQANIRTFYRIGSGDGPKLYSGLTIHPEDIRTFKFDNRKSMADASELDYGNNGDVRFKVKVTSHIEMQKAGSKTKKVNKKVTVEYGDLDGELRTFNVIGMSEAEMKIYAEQQYEKLKQGGLQGSFKAFGGELIDKYDNVEITLDGNRIGTYQVDKNEISWGSNGFRQEITLGTRMSD